MDAELLTEAMVAELRQEIKELAKSSTEGGTGVERLNKFEQGVRKVLNGVGAGLTQRHIEREARVHEGGCRDCAKCGERMRNVSRESITVQGIFGPMVVHRTRYSCETCKSNEYPVDAYYGWSEHRFTPTAKEWICLMSQGEAYEEAVRILRRLTGMEGAQHSFRGVVQECGGEMLRQRSEEVRRINETDEPLPQGEAPTPWMLVGADGCQILKSGEMVGKRKKEREARKGRKQGRRAQGREKRRGQRDRASEQERGMEVKVGLVGALVKNAQGEYETQKKSYVSTMERVEGFTDLVFLESARRGVLNSEQVVVMGDGAHWIWNHIAPLFPRERRIDIVDWQHLEDHVEDTSEALYGSRESVAAKRWTQQQLNNLWEGKPDGVSRALNAQSRKWQKRRGAAADKAREAIDGLARYLSDNQTRIDYPRYRKMGLPIGTGEVEAACKNVVARRMKQSGMQWRPHTAEPVLFLRAEYESERWDQRWQQFRSSQHALTTD